MIEILIKNYKQKERRLIEKAFLFASHYHRDQKRDNGEPYITHPVKAAEFLASLKLDAATVAACLLHDVLEDTEATREKLLEEFGQEITFLVEGVTKLSKLKYSFLERQAESLKKIFLAMAQDIRVVLIKLADRYHNMLTLKHSSREKQLRIAKETLEIYAPLAHRLGIGELKGQLEDLAFPYLYTKEYQWIVNQLKEKRAVQEKYLNRIKPILKRELLKNHLHPVEIQSRAKHYWSLYKKLEKRNMDFSKIYDLIAVRIILKNITDCYNALGIIHEKWQPLPGLIKDYIARPKINGYKSLHTTVVGPKGKIIEIQLRTAQMHDQAEYGIAAHWRYKEKKYLPKETTFQNNLSRELAWVNKLRSWQKENQNPKEFLEALKIDFFKDRIFVLTPKGEVIDLPEGATPIDFAYKIHTELGHRLKGVLIDGKIIPIDQELLNGQVIEIITSTKPKAPSRDWLEIAKTNETKKKIRTYFKKLSYEENSKKGLELLNRDLKQIKNTVFEKIEKEKIESLLKKTNFNKIEDLFAAVGTGDIGPIQIIKKLFKEEEIFQQPPQKPSLAKLNVVAQILVSGQEGLFTQLAKCCSPLPGQEIKGYITTLSKVSIHKIDCPSILNCQNKKRLAEAKWITSFALDKTYPVTLSLDIIDRIGLLKDIGIVIEQLKINILDIKNFNSTENEKGKINLTVEIVDIEELKRLINKLKGIKSVNKVIRTA